ncbi:T9SS type A sorting domain-containing protein [Flavobacterium sp. TP390]|uniref:T9SS type A sorting domain-containing protein n=1 Tax=Flavobacterium profundi TaxID=1774945 RepID=A0A6I4II06_9FLAO|nr:T9SS type A sorting domain-containing protein [Flavobacterium profundi]MVO09310.1 T9SS type A sorting domain-containing protein [Flavobacterium profundi]
MRKKLLQSLLPCFLLSVCYSQTTLPNPDFENWQNVGSSTEEPTNWNSNKTGGGFASIGPQTCFRESTNPQNGTYCLKLETKSYFGSANVGYGTTGKINAPTSNPNDTYAETVRSDSNFNSPFTGRPDAFLGFFRNTYVGGNSGKIQIILHGDYDVRNPIDANSTPYIIGTAEFTIPSSSTAAWTSFNVPITYLSTDTPSYVLIIADSGNQVGNILWVDNLSLDYSLNAIDFENSNTSVIYPNPTSGNFTLDLKEKNDITISIYDILGKLIYTKTDINDTTFTSNIDLETGTYMVQIISKDKTENIKLIVK